MTTTGKATAPRALLIAYGWCWAAVLLIGMAAASWYGFAVGAGTVLVTPLLCILCTGSLAATLIVAARPGGMARSRSLSKLTAEISPGTQWQVIVVNSCGIALSRPEMDNAITGEDFDEDGMPDLIYVVRRSGLANPFPVGEPMPEDLDHDNEVHEYYDVADKRVAHVLSIWDDADVTASELNRG